ncbi:MAG: hypothetical protein Q9224_007669, partial [Gallowayella concinna]
DLMQALDEHDALRQIYTQMTTTKSNLDAAIADEVKQPDRIKTLAEEYLEYRNTLTRKWSGFQTVAKNTAGAKA